MNQALSFEKVTRVFGERYALRDVTFALALGESVILTGHNGSGKTTLLRIAATLLAPTRGTLSILGVPYSEARLATRRSIGALFMNGYLHDDLTVDENLTFYSRLYEITDARKKLLQWLDDLDMRRFLYEPVRHLSRGERQKIALIRTLMPEPKLLLMDEPTTGLDASANAFLAETLRKLRSHTSILCATHQPELLQRIADREITLKDGRVH